MYINLTNMLVLRTPEQIIEFNEEYGSVPEWANDKSLSRITRSHYIDWPRITEEYNGIEINPYQWSLRHELMWYYGWDVSSGCIWNPESIIDFKEIKRVTFKRKGYMMRDRIRKGTKGN